MKRRILRSVVVGALVLLVAIQLVPVDRSNPPVQGVVDAPEPALAVLRRACFDCHSNQTRWRWYAYVAPVSWIVAHDVEEARGELNFTEWNHASARQRAKAAEESYEEASEGHMPLPRYLRAHPEARLTEADLSALQAWAAGAGEGR
jgi:hypothetical protein